jgi:uncharacterized membrane protein YeaQ/YmgE (transglycosylase-associated protein family)
MPAFSWLIIGGAVGLVARNVIGGKAYGILVDTLLGICGSCLANWILRIPGVDLRTSWADKTAIMIWAAVPFLLFARFIAKRRVVGRTPCAEPRTPAPQMRPRTQSPSLERSPIGTTGRNEYLAMPNKAGEPNLSSPRDLALKY